MKICTKCKIPKPETEFWPRKKSKDGLQHQCKTCIGSALKKHYKRNSEKIKGDIRVLQESIAQEINEIKASIGCKFCPEKEPVCLDFHHPNQEEKEAAVSYWVRCKSREKAIAEAKKCIVVCSNCHRKIHAGLLKI